MSAIEQPRVEMLFQLLDLKRHGRLRHEQHFGRFRKGQLLGNGMENLEPAVSHNYHPPIYLWCLFNHKLPV